MSLTQDAFNEVCENAKQAQGYYVTLMVITCGYGGPEEGGWWINDHRISAYKYFTTEEAAQAAYEAVKKLAEQKTAEARKAHGDLCLSQMDYLDNRGLDADFLPENDGPDEYYVIMTEGMAEESFGPTHYE